MLLFCMVQGRFNSLQILHSLKQFRSSGVRILPTTAPLTSLTSSTLTTAGREPFGD